jgi:hypothetical protein
MEFLVSSNLNIPSQGNEPTFVVHKRKEVTDLIPWTNKTGNLVSNWHVSGEPSVSDHTYIFFQTDTTAINKVTFRDPKRTNWESCKDNLKVETMSLSIHMIRDTDLAADQLQQAIISFYHNNFPAKTTHSPRKAPWWNRRLSGLMAKTRRLFNIARRTGHCDT